MIAMLHYVEDNLDDQILYLLYDSLIVPYLTLCVEVWGNAFKTSIQPIFIWQKRAIRIITRNQHRETLNPVFVKLQVLKFSLSWFQYVADYVQSS